MCSGNKFTKRVGLPSSYKEAESVLRLYQFVARDDVVLATLYGLARVPAPDTFGHAVSKN